MKLTRTIKVTEQEFYDHLEQEVLAAIRKCSQQECSVKDIKKGLRYSEHADNPHTRVDITILEYERGSYYKSEMKSANDTITISYTTQVEKDGLKLVLQQHIDSFEKKRHNRFMKMFSEGVYLGRMSDTIYDLQKKIIKKREQETI